MAKRPLNILVTGAAGYIGSILVPELLKNGYEVIALDNFMYGQASLLDCCHERKLTIVRGDVRDKNLMAKLLQKADAILPLACLTGAPLCQKNPFEARAINVDAVKMILKLRSKKQIIIFPTTNSGYGLGQENIFCTEETPLRPVSLYGKLKVEIEKALLDAKNCITLRLATTFGISPRMRLDLLVNDFVYRAVNDHYVILYQAHYKRNYIHVRDTAAAFVHCLKIFSKIKDQPYNVGLSQANLSKLELCYQIKKQVPDFYFVEAKVGEDQDKRNYIVSSEKIQKTGFHAAISLQDGIAELIKGYQVIRNNRFTNS